MLLEPLAKALPRFASRSHQVDDAKLEEKRRNALVVWTAAERKTFAERWVQYPKNFRKLATYFEFKTVGDCVAFYDREKHELELKKMIKKGRVKGGYGSGTPSARPPPAARSASANLPRHVLELYEDMVVPTNREGMRARPRHICFPCTLPSATQLTCL
jgi:hypothetical protein